MRQSEPNVRPFGRSADDDRDRQTFYLGRFVMRHRTVPGLINFDREVNRWVIDHEP